MIISYAITKIMKSICDTFTKTRRIGTMTSYMRRNNFPRAVQIRFNRGSEMKNSKRDLKKKIKTVYRWIISKEKLFFMVFFLIHIAMIVLHIIFYTQDDKLARGVELTTLPFIVYLGMIYSFKLVRKYFESLYFCSVAFSASVESVFIIMFLVEYILNFPAENAIAPLLCMVGFLEAIREMKIIVSDPMDQ